MSWIPKKTIVVPCDFSEDSLAAIDVALQMVAQPQDLHVLHVLPELSPLEPGELWETIDDKSRVEHAKQAIRDRLANPKYRDVIVEVQFGDPGHTIARYAKDVNADLIVMPSHGRTGLSHILLGSVAERVVRLAHCGVLVLRH